MYSYLICLWGSPHNLHQVYVLLSNLSMRVPHNLPRVYYILFSNLTMRVTPHNLPQVYVLLSNLSMRVPPQSPTGILCTLIQSDYEGPHNLSQVYVLLSNLTMRVPHNLSQVYVLLSNLTMMVPPQSPSGICTLIQSDYDGPPTISLRYMYSYLIWLWGCPPTISLRYMYSYPIWLWWYPHNLYVLLSRVPPQSPSSICIYVLLYSYPIWLRVPP